MAQVKRSDVELDICPQCRGVWLDRGELEKLLQPLREQAETPSAPTYDGRRGRQYDEDSDHDEHDRRGWGHEEDHGRKESHHGRYGRKQGWRNILDVFD
jgi:Zn-finger nucleic acid-binding protein